MRKIVLLCFFVVALASLNSFLNAQNNPLYLKPALDSKGRDLILIDSTRFLLLTLQRNLEYRSLANDISSEFEEVFYLMTTDFQLLDSLKINTADGLDIHLINTIKISDSLFVTSGFAYDSTSANDQLYLCWFGLDLKIKKDTLINKPGYKQLPGSASLNPVGNIVIGVANMKSSTGIIESITYFEIDADGGVIQEVKQTDNQLNTSLIPFGDLGQYFTIRYDLAILNNDFSISRIYDLPIFYNFTKMDYGVMNDTSFYLAGSYHGSAISSNEQHRSFSKTKLIFIGSTGYTNGHKYLESADADTYFRDISITSDAIYVASAEIPVSDETNTKRAVVVKMDHQLNIQYKASYGEENELFSISSVLPLNDGGFIATGSKKDSEDDLSYSIFVIRFNSSGQLTNVIDLASPQFNKILLSPNPTSDQLYIMDELYCWKSATIFDQQGKIVSQNKIEGCNSLIVGHLTTGLYTVRLESDSGQKAYSRFIKM